MVSWWISELNVTGYLNCRNKICIKIHIFFPSVSERRSELEGKQNLQIGGGARWWDERDKHQCDAEIKTEISIMGKEERVLSEKTNDKLELGVCVC